MAGTVVIWVAYTATSDYGVNQKELLRQGRGGGQGRSVACCSSLLQLVSVLMLVAPITNESYIDVLDMG